MHIGCIKGDWRGRRESRRERDGFVLSSFFVLLTNRISWLVACMVRGEGKKVLWLGRRHCVSYADKIEGFVGAYNLYGTTVTIVKMNTCTDPHQSLSMGYCTRVQPEQVGNRALAHR